MPFPEKAEYSAKCILELIHGDLCGPITPMTLGGKKMFLLLVNDFSRYMWVAQLPSKDCTPEAIKVLRAQAKVVSGQSLSFLCMGHGREFTSQDFNKHCAKMGVRR
jgi:hypothetical protein